MRCGFWFQGHWRVGTTGEVTHRGQGSSNHLFRAMPLHHREVVPLVVEHEVEHLADGQFAEKGVGKLVAIELGVARAGEILCWKSSGFGPFSSVCGPSWRRVDL